MRKVLVVEDETDIRDFIVINLKRGGYDVTDVDCGEKALEVYESSGGDFDIVLLDVMMPGIDGFTVCRRIREKSDTVGIIMLSAKTQEMDKVTGLMLGADDYVPKPFSPSELVARVDAIHRRVAAASSMKNKSEDLVSGPFTLHIKSRTLTKNGENVDLTQVEFQLMELFMKNPNVAMTRLEILSKVWGENFYGDEKLVDVNIRRLRMKIESDASSPEYLLTIWGYGYKWSE